MYFSQPVVRLTNVFSLTRLCGSATARINDVLTLVLACSPTIDWTAFKSTELIVYVSQGHVILVRCKLKHLVNVADTIMANVIMGM